jgi:hypothetical protein
MDELSVSNGITADNHKKVFDIEAVCDSLEKCITDKNAIDLDLYLRGFNELLRFLSIIFVII